MTQLEIFLHIAPKVILITLPVLAADIFVVRYLERREARRDNQREARRRRRQ